MFALGLRISGEVCPLEGPASSAQRVDGSLQQKVAGWSALNARGPGISPRKRPANSQWGHTTAPIRQAQAVIAELRIHVARLEEENRSLRA
jgi:hypothetical protein